MATKEQLRQLLGSPVSVEVHHEIEQFLFAEVDLIDGFQFREWAELLAEDLHYWSPVRQNRTTRDFHKEEEKPGASAFFNDTRADMVERVERLYTRMAWSEEPASRTRHLISNVRACETDVAGEFEVGSSFIVYRTRMERDQDLIAGRRYDLLRRAENPFGFEVARRKVLFDVSIVLIKNLSSFY